MRTQVRKRARLLAISVVALVVLTSGIWWMFIRDSRQDMSLDALTHFDGTGYSFVFDDLRSEPCDDVPECVESASGTYADLFKFEDQEAAEQFVANHPDAHQSDWMVIVFTDESLSSRERDGAFDLLDDTWSAQ